MCVPAPGRRAHPARHRYPADGGMLDFFRDSAMTPATAVAPAFAAGNFGNTRTVRYNALF